MPTPRVLLLVEDTVDDAELAMIALRRSGHVESIVAVRDGEQALDYLFGRRAHSGRDTSLQPSLILLDLKLPKIDGFGVLAQARGDPRTRAIPVVVLTSSTERQDVVRAYELGANCYLRKPTDYQVYSATLAKICEFWLELNVTPWSV
jgi:two-component system response regulator